VEKEKESVRLGGMALQNGVLVHGPKAWGCAVRDEEGNLRVASGLKPSFSSRVRTPVLRGPARLAEAFALLPVVRRALPQARYPFERPAILGSIVASSVAVRAIRRNDLLSPGASEMAAAAASLVPALVALRGPDLAAYHGAEHVSIGTYETGEPAPKEHPRCGSQLIAPMVASTMLANAAWGAQDRTARRCGRRRGCVRRALRLVGPQPGAHPVESALPAGPRAPAAVLDRGAVGRAARGRERGPRRLPRARSLTAVHLGRRWAD